MDEDQTPAYNLRAAGKLAVKLAVKAKTGFKTRLSTALRNAALPIRHVNDSHCDPYGKCIKVRVWEVIRPFPNRRFFLRRPDMHPRLRQFGGDGRPGLPLQLPICWWGSIAPCLWPCC